jgi:hypothetical protein
MASFTPEAGPEGGRHRALGEEGGPLQPKRRGKNRLQQIEEMIKVTINQLSGAETVFLRNIRLISYVQKEVWVEIHLIDKTLFK